ncbi:F-box protein At5g49610-like [Aegilops tauschii subsp. strangulata]|uniref:F-box protein At5g49610-like n=1 Tax=Aegilops tauschii subsp. strangulata TaxID=200361 RepID=UPI00098B623E|nr:F-box protein At5g49610-like [Aegilops tauschii subsp. strangulata]
MEADKERNTKPRLDDHPGATALTDDLILEILSRLPARSLHRFKCVSVPWRDLIADPANRKKLPQTLAGFLYMTVHKSGHGHHFASVSGDGAAAPFDLSLPYLHHSKDEGMIHVHACNGLLLYRSYKKSKVARSKEDDFRFVVCNPITRRWVELPRLPSKRYSRTIGLALDPVTVNIHSRTTGLAFDPAESSHFHVLHFEQTVQEPYVTGVYIYSSRTRAWTHRDCEMAEKVKLFFGSRCIYVGGMLYLMGSLKRNGGHLLLGVDMEGKVWKTISLPFGRRFGTIGSLQGCLHYAVASRDDNNKICGLELWCLKDYDSKELVLKHTAGFAKLMSLPGKQYRAEEIHPDCDTIFLVSFYRGSTLVAYDMRHQKVGCVLDLEKRNTQLFLPYAPLYSESLADADGQ